MRERGALRLVWQASPSECAAACLAMACGQFGEPPRRVFEKLQTGRDGHTLADVIDAAASLGYASEALRLEAVDVAMLPAGSILHWNMNHFVVLQGVDRRWVSILDPALGARRIRPADFSRQFTGVALVVSGPARERHSSCPKELSPTSELLKSHLKSNWYNLVFIASCAALLQLGNVVLARFVRVLVDRVFPTSSPVLGEFAIATVAIVALFASVWVVRTLLLQHLRNKVDRVLHRQVVERLIRIPYASLCHYSASDLAHRLSGLSSLRETATGVTMSLGVDGALAFICLLGVYSIDARLGTFVAGLAALQLVAVLSLAARRRSLGTIALEAQNAAQARQLEVIACMDIYKGFGLEDRACMVIAEAHQQELSASATRGRFEAKYDGLIAAMRFGALPACYLVGGYGLYKHGLSLGSVVAAVALGLAAIGPVSALIAAVGQLQLARIHLDRLDRLIVQAPRAIQSTSAPAPSHAGAGLTFREVSFAYPGSPRILRDVSLSVRPGECVVIFGRSGCGKSSLGRLAAGVLTPTAGFVELDAVPIADVVGHGRVVMCPQTPRVVAGTVFENIAFYDPALSRADARKAAETACLLADIESMPLGFETFLVEGGATLSGGQMQRLSLARALCRRPDVVILDESTSALDVVTEHQVLQNIRRLGCATLIISHRPHVAATADRVVVIEDGKIAEQGAHAELLLLDGAYAKMVAHV